MGSFRPIAVALVSVLKKWSLVLNSVLDFFFNSFHFRSTYTVDYWCFINTAYLPNLLQCSTMATHTFYFAVCLGVH
jgi:hypothetical protein